jgi:hypothetical protein
VILGVLHHTDHVLRWDHSGWPFRPQVTPFTFSLLVYPILIPLFFHGVSYTYRIVALTVVFLFVQSAHIFLERPADQFHTWADGVSHFQPAYGKPRSAPSVTVSGGGRRYDLAAAVARARRGVDPDLSRSAALARTLLGVRQSRVLETREETRS